MRVKKMMIKSMDFVMLDCKQATYLVTKKLDGKLSAFESTRLKLHLKTCDFCREYDIQSSKIDAVLKQTPDDLDQKYTHKHRLDTKKKQEIVKKIVDNQ